jgi:eukaryotic-like serine/threonine-protein kinase
MNCPSCLAGNLAGACHCFACGATLDPALDSLRDGALFASRYEITGPLGRGGMGMVYRAHDRELGEPVAIKVLRPDLAAESCRIEERFRSEIRLARRVRHRNVCSVYGDGEDRGLLYICMELVEGENLKRRTREDGGLPEEEAWDVALQVLRGLEAIHEVGIVHRDLKTANLMRDRRGVVRVMDFGIAKHNAEDDAEATVTATGTLIGTPEYMSPEQLRGGAVDFRSDLYSLAIVIHELFTGELPFRGTSAVTTIVRQLQEPPSLSPALPESLRPVLARALAKRAHERFATAAEMRQAVEEARLAPAGPAPARPSQLSPDATDDATRPVDRDAFPERVPFARLIAAQLMLIAFSAHLIASGGVVPPPVPVAVARPAAPKPPPRRPIVKAVRHVARPAAPPVVSVAVASIRPQAQPVSATSATPSPTPAPATAPAAPMAASALDPARGRVDTTRVYDEDEVDVKPRRIEGTTAPYPEWGPRLSRGKRASIVASFVVTESGDVTEIRVEEGGGVLEAVLPEMSRWKWQPGTKRGVPVKVRMRWRQTYVGGP